MARQRPTGLPIPRVENAELQRFLELVAVRLSDPDFGGGAGTGSSGTGTGTGTGTSPGTTDPDSGTTLPTPEVPPTPTGLDALGGIGIVFVTWNNPFRIYGNHSRTNIYRNIVDQFGTATKIGQSPYVMYTDDDVESDHTYFYWVTWTNTLDVEGPPSVSVEVETATDPEEFYEKIQDWLLNSRLLADLRSPIVVPAVEFPTWLVQEFPEWILIEARQLAVGTATLVQESAARARELANTAQEGVVALQETINSLTANEGGFVRGPPPNIFADNTRALAEAQRDAQGTANAPWLAEYDGDSLKYITLHFD